MSDDRSEEVVARIDSDASNRPRVLFIAIEFPPVQSTGMFRSLRFASRLSAHGIDPLVVSIDPKEGTKVFGVPQNLSLLAELPAHTEIHRLHYGDTQGARTRLSRYAKMFFRVSDGYYEKLRGGLDALLSRSDAKSIDAIYATLPPFGAGQLGLHAQRRLKVPLIVDMRDAWSEFGSNPFPSYFHFLGVRRLEQQVLRAASRVIAVTPQLCDMLHRVVPERNRDDFLLIPNASEAKEFPKQLEWLPNDVNGTIDIGYVGGFYFDARYHRLRSTPWYRKSPHHALHYYSTQQDWLYRTPHFFFRTWQEVDRIHPDLGSRIRFHLIGDTPDWLAGMAERFGVLNRCCWHGRLLKQEVREKLKSFALMLSTSIKVHDGEDFCLASKTFEYLDAGKPMLGFVCAGAQRDFLVNSRTGIVMDPDDLSTSAQNMCKTLGEGVRLTPDAAYLQAFSADATARKLAETIQSLVPSKSQGADAG